MDNNVHLTQTESPLGGGKFTLHRVPKKEIITDDMARLGVERITIVLAILNLILKPSP